MSESGFMAEEALFRRAGGILRMSDALRLGITRQRLYLMRDAGAIEPLSRGLYRLSALPPLSHPDLVSAALRVPEGVICLVSALDFHEMTTQIPKLVQVAIERGKKEPPRIDYPPVQVFRFSGLAFRDGARTHVLDGVEVQIYQPEKTVVDCFKFRNRLGMDIAREALKRWWERPDRDTDALFRHARNCRVDKIIRPYLEALV